MLRMGWMLPLVVLGVGCQKSPGIFEEQPNQPPVQQPTQQPDYGPGGMQQGQPGAGGMGTDGMQGQEPGGEGMQPGTLGQRGQEPVWSQPLRNNVQNMRTAETFRHTDLVKSIRDLTNALQSLPDAGAGLQDAVSRINSYADRIEAAGAESNMQARWAKRAFNEAVVALDDYQKDQNLTGMSDRIANLRSQVEMIQDDQAFMEQRANFANVYEQITDTLIVASMPMEAPERGTR